MTSPDPAPPVTLPPATEASVAVSEPRKSLRQMVREHFLVGLLILLVLGLGTALEKRIPAVSEVRRRPFTASGRLGEWVGMRSGEVKVTQLLAASTLKTETEQALAAKNSLFLILKVEFVAGNKPGGLEAFSVQTKDGREFGGVPPVGSGSCYGAQPGIPVHCDMIVEVDRQALTGATLRVAEDAAFQGEGDSVALIDLGIDAARTMALTKAASSYNVQVRPQIEEP